MELKNKYARAFQEMVESRLEGRENVIEDIIGLLEAGAYQSVYENYLLAEDLGEYLLPHEIAMLRDICTDRKSNPGMLN